jgi:hypothetical protein
MKSNKKSQASSYIGIMLLILVIVIFAMFGRVGSSTKYVRESEESLKKYQMNRFLITSKVFPFITINRVPIEQLMGVYMCYDSEIIDYGIGEINFTKEVIEILDTAIGEDLWSLQVGDITCIKGNTISKQPCTLPIDKSFMSQEFGFALPCKPEVDKAVLFVERD